MHYLSHISSLQGDAVHYFLHLNQDKTQCFALTINSEFFNLNYAAIALQQPIRTQNDD